MVDPHSDIAANNDIRNCEDNDDVDDDGKNRRL